MTQVPNVSSGGTKDSSNSTFAPEAMRKWLNVAVWSRLFVPPGAIPMEAYNWPEVKLARDAPGNTAFVVVPLGVVTVMLVLLFIVNVHVPTADALVIWASVPVS